MSAFQNFVNQTSGSMRRTGLVGRRKPSLEKIKIPDNQENLDTPFEIVDSSVTKEGFSPPWAEWDFNEWETCTDVVGI